MFEQVFSESPKILPGPSPIVLPGAKNKQDYHRLAIGVLAYGNNVSRLSMWTGSDPKKIKDTIEDQDFLIYLAGLGESDVLPSRKSIYALYRVESEVAERSADRMKALDRLLEICPQAVPDDKVDEFRRPKSQTG